jgi:hypothetical protein
MWKIIVVLVWSTINMAVFLCTVAVSRLKFVFSIARVFKHRLLFHEKDSNDCVLFLKGALVVGF